jgi:hypothetical protein
MDQMKAMMLSLQSEVRNISAIWQEISEESEEEEEVSARIDGGR